MLYFQILILNGIALDIRIIQTNYFQVIYKKERSQLQKLQRKIRNNIVKQELKVQQLLFAIYSSEATSQVDAVRYRSNVFPLGSQTLLEASRSGLQQLIYLLVKVGGLPVDAVVDPTSGTTALHHAASRGKSGVILLLLSLGAWPLLPDRYGQTPPHLASMFAHQHAYEIFDKFLMKYNLYCRAGTVPQEIRGNFLKRLEMFNSCNYASRLSIHEINTDQIEATKNLLRHIDFAKLVGCTQKETIDFTSGEAQEIRDAVMKELQQIMKKISSGTFKGKLRLVGSSADGTRIGYPDSYDVNFVIEKLPEVEVNILQQKLEDVLVSGHKLTVELKTEDNTFQGNNLITKFYKYVWSCLKSYILLNRKLSLVPPGLTRTRVGVKLSLAWQGSEYPLLLIDVDLVPVLVVPWPEEISRPYLTPDSSHMIHLSNTEDGTYICNFAATEVEVVQQLEPQEHQVFLTCKTLLSRMEAQPWMPRHMKNQFSWWDSRYWKIPTPAGFCLKNTFFKQVEKKRKKGINWQKKDLIILVTSIFQGMCLETDGSSPGARSLVPAKINAYFGIECARSKVAEGAPEIVNFLRKSFRN